MRAALLFLALGGCMIRQARESYRWDSHGRLVEEVIRTRQEGCSPGVGPCHGEENQTCEVVQICVATVDIEERLLYRYDVLGRPIARWHRAIHSMGGKVVWRSELTEDVDWKWDGSRPTPINPRDRRVIEDSSLVAKARAVYGMALR